MGGSYLRLQLAGQVTAQELAAVRLRLAARHRGKNVRPWAREDSLCQQGYVGETPGDKDTSRNSV